MRSSERDAMIADRAAALGLMVAFATMVFVGGGVSLCPLRVCVVGTAPGLFSGRYCASWSWLPLRPQTIRRVVFAHALLVPLLVQEGCVVCGRTFRALSATAREVMPSSTPGRSHVTGAEGWLIVAALGLALVCWAGWTLCMAVGDRVRGTLAAVGIGLSLVGIGLTAWLDVTQDLSSKSFAAEVVLLGVAAVFAALPLANLRRPRRVP
jgi:hypothetical protein